MNPNPSTRSFPALNSEWFIASSSSSCQVSSSIDRSRLLGKPTVYLVIDCLSQTILGSHADLEGNDQLGWLLAFENALAEKTSSCRNLGIEISAADYPCHHICDTLLIKSKVKGGIINSLAEFGVQVKISNPRQLVQMSRIEASLERCMLSPISFNTSDRRLDGVLNFNQFRRLLVQSILHYNHQKLESYPDERTDQSVELSPIDLWNWGLRDSSNSPRVAPSESTRLKLLPQAAASITSKGIAFQGLHYTCKTAIDDHWFTSARVGTKNKVTLAYDPRSVDVVYLIPANGDEPELCHLTAQHKLFHGQSWCEVKSYFADVIKRKQRIRADFALDREEILNEATKRKFGHLMKKFP